MFLPGHLSPSGGCVFSDGAWHVAFFLILHHSWETAVWMWHRINAYHLCHVVPFLKSLHWDIVFCLFLFLLRLLTLIYEALHRLTLAFVHTYDTFLPVTLACPTSPCSATQRSSVSAKQLHNSSCFPFHATTKNNQVPFASSYYLIWLGCSTLSDHILGGAVVQQIPNQ